METFTFASKTTPGMVYTTVLHDNGFLTCNCKGYTIRDKRECTHTKQVAVAEGITPAALPPPASQVNLFDEPTGFVEPMLASAMKDSQSIRDYEGKLEWIMEEKFDGHRLIVRVLPGDDVVAWSRQGNIRRLAPHVEAECKRLAYGTYDGELIIPGGTSTDVTALDKLGTSMLMLFDILKVGLSDGGGQDIETMQLPQQERRHLLEEATSKLNYDSTGVRMAVQYDPFEVVLRNIWTRGGEGAVLKHRTAVYEPGKRNRQWLKLKKLQAATLTIIGFEEGLLGPHAMIRLRDEHGVEITVKSLNDEWRATFASRAQDYIGRGLVIQYQEKTRDGRYRHPMADHILED